VQILWINMVTAVALGLTLAFEPTEPGVMRRPPRRRDEPLLSGDLVWRIVLVSVLFVDRRLRHVLLGQGRGLLPIEEARTIVVNTIVVMEIFYLFSVRYVHATSLTWRGRAGHAGRADRRASHVFRRQPSNVLRRQLLNAAAGSQERVETTHLADVAPVLEIFRQQLVAAVHLGVGPQMGVEPGKVVHGHAVKRSSHDPLVGPQHRKLSHQAFRLEGGRVGSEQRCAAQIDSGPSGGRHEFDDGLMGNEHVAPRMTFAEDALGDVIACPGFAGRSSTPGCWCQSGLPRVYRSSRRQPRSALGSTGSVMWRSRSRWRSMAASNSRSRSSRLSVPGAWRPWGTKRMTSPAASNVISSPGAMPYWSARRFGSVICSLLVTLDTPLP
jgi:hypothetical protein